MNSELNEEELFIEQFLVKLIIQGKHKYDAERREVACSSGAKVHLIGF